MINWTFVELDEVGSTQAVAKGLAAMGAPEGTTVVAKSQSAGEGRMGRGWVSPIGGLYMSFVLRPENLHRPELVSLVAAVAAVQGVRRSTGLGARIRWPNDIIVGSKKLGGILAEAQSYKHEITQILVGVGVNCNAPVVGMEATGGEATSLIEELGKPIELSELKHSILESFSILYDRWKGGENLASLWAENIGTVGKEVTVKMKTDETPFSCEAVAIEPDGGLAVARGGEHIVIHAEDMEWLREKL